MKGRNTYQPDTEKQVQYNISIGKKKMKREANDFQNLKLSFPSKPDQSTLDKSKFFYNPKDKNNTRKSDRTKKERKIADYTEFTRFYHENALAEGEETLMEIENNTGTSTPRQTTTPSHSRSRQRKPEKQKPKITVKRKMIKKTGGKRGRPRLNPEEKKKRSLIRKADTKASKKGGRTAKKQSLHHSAGDGNKGAPPPEPILKRPPGRPRKYLTPEESAEAKRKSTFKQLKALSNISLYQAMVQVKDFLRRQKKNKLNKLI